MGSRESRESRGPGSRESGGPGSRELGGLGNLGSLWVKGPKESRDLESLGTLRVHSLDR